VGGIKAVQLAVDYYGDEIYNALCSVLPRFETNEKLYGAAVVATSCIVAKVAIDRNHRRSLKRAKLIQSTVRVVMPKEPVVVAALLDKLFLPTDRVEAIRSMYVGQSANQKLERLKLIVELLGFESLVVFGDCFDEVSYLDPVGCYQVKIDHLGQCFRLSTPTRSRRLQEKLARTICLISED